MAVRLGIRTAFVATTVFLIGVTSATIGITTYRNTRAVVDDLSEEILAEVSAKAVAQTTIYLDSATSIIELNRDMILDRFIGPDDTETLTHYLLRVLRTHKLFSWAWYADENGNAMGAFRKPDGQLGVNRIYYENGAFRLVDKLVQANGSQVESRVIDPYPASKDPRTRPFYTRSKKRREPVWTPPYMFVIWTPPQPGITYTSPLVIDGTFRGVLTMDFELSFLSKLVRRIKVGKTGKLALITNAGKLVAHPDPEMIVDNSGGSATLASVFDTRDELMREAAKLLPLRTEAGSRIIDLDGPRQYSMTRGGVTYKVSATPFSLSDDLRWLVLIVVPENDFLGDVKKQNRTTLMICIIGLAVSILAGFVLAGAIARPLRRMFAELDRVGRLAVIEGEPVTQKSMITEVNTMAETISRMEASLRSFNKYVPRDIVQFLLATGTEAELGGDEQTATVFFSDIVGFTSISERLEPPQLVGALNDYLDEMSAVVVANQGTLDKYIGDAIMAFWNAPTPCEDHAYLACKAALECERRLAELRNGRWKDRDIPAFESRIGLNTGDLIVGNIGSKFRLNYSVIGDSVNLASRLEAVNKTYGTTIICSETTRAELGDRVVVKKLDLVAVKGKSAAVAIYEVVGLAGDVDDRTLERIDTHERALAAYLERDFAAASELFASLGSDDPLVDLYQGRCRAYRETPPPKDWDGVHVFTKK